MTELEMDIKSLEIQLNDINQSQIEVDKNIQSWLKRSRELAHKYHGIKKQLNKLKEEKDA